jgi:hypothetical protein
MLNKMYRLGPYNAIALLAVLAILTGLFTGVLSVNSAAPLVLSSFLSTFLGATYAFRLNEKKEAEKKRDEHRAALQLALFTMARQYNSLVNLWNSVKDWEKRGDRALNMPALHLPTYEKLTIDFERLTFLLDTPSPMLLLELSIEQERFTQTIIAAIMRSKFHVDEVQTEIAKRHLNQKVMRLDEMAEVIGERIFGTIENQTNDLFAHLSSSLRSLPVAAKKLFDIAKAEYPDKKFATVQFITADELEKDSLVEGPTTTPETNL